MPSPFPTRLALVLLIILTGPLYGQVLAYRFDGAGGSGLGQSVGDAGDIDGDGVTDLVIGVPHADVNGVDSGSVVVRSGADGSVLFTFHGAAPGDELGFSVSGAGDVDGDGRDDIVAGAVRATGNQASSGIVYVYSGIDGTILHTIPGDTASSRFGHSVNRAGDVNGDGYADVIVGAPFDETGPTNQGVVYVFSGLTGYLMRGFIGENAYDNLGWSVDHAGDVNGDGVPDHVLGAPYHGANSGRIYVHSGVLGTTLHTFDGGTVGERLGSSVAGAGDVDGDGRDDVVAGAPEAAGTRGQVRVFSGAAGTLLHEFTGSAALDFLGRAVSDAGDVDGDGFADVMAGAEGSSGTFRGYARIWSGRDGAVIATLDGGAAGDHFGKSVSSAGPDRVIVGAPRTDPVTWNDGTAFVFDFPPFQLTVSQPTPTSLLVANTNGEPGHEYFTAFTFDPANANGGLGSGWFLGLYINPTDVAVQLTAGPPFRGTLDVTGASAWFLPPGGLSGVSGLTIYGVTVTTDPSLQTVSGVSNLVAYTFQ